MSPTRTTASCRCAEMTARSSSSSANSLRSVIAASLKRRGAPRISVLPAHCSSLIGTVELARKPFDFGAAAGKLVLQPLETAVEMIDAVHDGLAARREPGNDQRYRRPEIGRHHLSA